MENNNQGEERKRGTDSSEWVNSDKQPHFSSENKNESNNGNERDFDN